MGPLLALFAAIALLSACEDSGGAATRDDAALAVDAFAGEPDGGPGGPDDLGFVEEDADPDAGPDPDAVSESDAAPDAQPPPAERDCTDAPATEIETVHVGEIAIEAGRSAPLSVDLPADVISLTIVGVGRDDGVLLAVESLAGPEGQILIDEAPPGVTISARDEFLSPFPGAFASPNRSATSSHLGAALAPNNPGVQLSPGTWTYGFGAVDLNRGRRADTVADVWLFIKRAASPPRCGTLDLHFHFTGAHEWTADSAPTDPDFQRELARMAGFYHRIGVSLGEITYHDIPERFRTVDALGGAGSALHEMFALNQQPDGLAIFFVDRFTSPFGDGVIGGLAGGLPGPPQPGTARSGVAVATALNPDPDAIGHIMGHEAGHYLGLFHTQETLGQVDQIEDTPTGRAGQSNLMFPTVTTGEATLSDGQAWVLHHSPIITSAGAQKESGR